MNKTVLKAVSKGVEKAAFYGASTASWFGWYQPRVPQKLLKVKK